MGRAASIDEGKDALLRKQRGLTPGFAETLVRITPVQRYALEAIDLEDQVRLEFNVCHAGERCRALERLSSGRRCTAILHLQNHDIQDPLIMDQPKDNLGNALIAERIVQELRGAKTERQFSFAAHNADIPVVRVQSGPEHALTRRIGPRCLSWRKSLSTFGKSAIGRHALSKGRAGVPAAQ